jgi:glycosyltransferase involved in cell wall biosynthesis
LGLVSNAGVQIGRRYRQILSLWRSEGATGIGNRVRRVAAERIAPKNVVLPVLREDVMKADLSRPLKGEVPKLMPGHDLWVNWLMAPPSAGSGGHTTIFRIIRYLATHGYRNRVYFYDVYGGDHAYYESIVRETFEFYGKVGNVANGMEDAHAVFATSWPTAYAAFNASCAGKRFYFVQDFEPYFYAVGATSLLAENTYRMGFHGVTAGRWLAKKLTTELGMKADDFPFGCDVDRYARTEESRRNGIVFYARPETARRGYELGVMAMQIFAERHPEVHLHFYGEPIHGLSFRIINHGRVRPEELNEIYNQCFAGLSLSLTNVSLVPHEMLAAGCIPVVNEGEQNRMVLNNPFVRYAKAYPEALAAELEAVMADPDFEVRSRLASASVRGISWEQAGATVDQIIRRELDAEITALSVVSSDLTTVAECKTDAFELSHCKMTL